MSTTLGRRRAPVRRDSAGGDSPGGHPPRSLRKPLRESSVFCWRSVSTLMTTALNRTLNALPPTRWFHRRSLDALGVTEIDWVDERFGPGLDGLTIAFLSDLHVGSFMGAAELLHVFERVAEREPDVVCFGGDLVNSRLREFQLLREPMALLRPPHGLFAVPGNHEIYFGLEGRPWQRFLDDHGIADATNRGFPVEVAGDRFWLAGVDDFEEGHPHLARALDGRNGEPTLLLSHHPDFFPHALDADVDLTLSGHTHGGQIKLFGRAIIQHSDHGFIEGEFERDAGRLYVSRGVGVTFLPIRWNCPAEWVLVTLRSGASVPSVREP